MTMTPVLPPLPSGTKLANGIGHAVPAGRLAQHEKLKQKADVQSTYTCQGKLPRLPIPTLEETLERFPQRLAALQTKQEQEETRRIVEEFKKGDGPKLQQLLLDYERQGVRTGKLGSYIEEFWNDSYLAPDASVVLNLNPYFVLEKGPDPKIAKNQLHRAASLTFAALKMASLLKHESLPPDQFRGKPLCMDQFKALFGATRVPGQLGEKDHVHVYPDSSHVVVMIKNQVYYFQALWPTDWSVAVDERDIHDILEAIQKHVTALTSEKEEESTAGGSHSPSNSGDQHRQTTNNQHHHHNNQQHQRHRDTRMYEHIEHVSEALFPCEGAIGALTSLSRKEWGAARKMIMEGDNKQNKAALHVIDSALFVLVLDDFVPKNPHEKAANMLHGSSHLVMDEKTNSLVQIGSCCNRWYDKLQLIVCANGTAGVNFEHSAIDGHTALRFVSDIFAETVVQFAQSITNLIYGSGWIPDTMDAKVNRAATSMVENAADHKQMLDVFPKKLVFDLPQKLIERIHYAETALSDELGASDTVVLEFHDYGKTMIVSNKLSPDSFVQMSLMLAYYKLYGKFVCSYEPVLTKSFYHGRTEAMRGATPEAKELCEIFCNKFATIEQKLAALRKATQEHSRLVKECAQGKGVDRHLFALKCIAERNNIEMPEFFKSKAWQTLNHTVISTSNCGNPSLSLFGFGPVVQDGFGIGYIIKDHGIQFSVSTKHRQTLRYVNTLENVLLEIKDMLKEEWNVVCHGHHDAVFNPHAMGRLSLKALPSFEDTTEIEIADSTIVSGRAVSEAIHDDEGSDDYGGFWGETEIVNSMDTIDEDDASDRAISEFATRKELALQKAEGNRIQDSNGNWFSNIVRRKSLQLMYRKNLGIRLSFDESQMSSNSLRSDYS